MDFTFVLFAPSLDSYVTAFEAAGEAFLPLSWVGEDGSTKYYSLLKQVPDTQVIFELVSDVAPSSSNVTFQEDPMVRVAASAFTDNSASSTEEGILTPLCVSKGVSNMSAIDDYYVNIFKATLTLDATVDYAASAAFFGDRARGSNGTTTVATVHGYKLEGAPVQLRFVQRDAAFTAGTFTVADWEQAKMRSYAAFATDPGCGFSKWYDNHYAWDQSTYDMETFVPLWEAGGWPWHVWAEPNNDVYAVDPTGDSIQMDTSWSACSSNEWCSSADGNGKCIVYTCPLPPPPPSFVFVFIPCAL